MKTSEKFKIIIYNIIFILLFDFFLGKQILNYANKKSFLLKPAEKLKLVVENERKYRISHPIFHHTLKENINTRSQFGDLIYKTCTDINGFRIKCGEIKKFDKDIILMGDSFTEGVGLNYEETFAGMLSNELKMNFYNMGVSSYSPVIYKKKIKFFLDQNIINPKEVLVFLDVSDIEDEFYYYECRNGQSVCSKKGYKQFPPNLPIIHKSKEKYFPMLSKFSTVLRDTKRKLFKKNEYPKKDVYRMGWTYLKKNEVVNTGITKSIKNMMELHSYLDSKNIPMSIAVFPWREHILYDVEESLQVKIWRDFCIDRCREFINFFPLFFKESKTSSKEEVVKKYFFKNDSHFNMLGNELIFKQLIKTNLFKN